MISSLKSYFSNVKKTSNPNSIIIVSGLPRSGTSMMMKMLAAGTIDVITDNLRAADEDNPVGYFEFERVKKLKDGDFEWLPEAKGKAVKVISALLEFLPSQFNYQVVFMQRRMSEILASQQKMLSNRGEPDSSVNDETMTRLYQKHLDTVREWLSRQSNFQVLQIEYNRLLTDSAHDLVRLRQFLNRPIDLEQMQAVIDSTLYRQRF